MRLLWNILWAPVLILAYIILPIVWWVVAGVYGALRSEWVKPKPSDTHGNASFATDKELEKAGNLSPGGYMLGVTQKTKRRVYSHPERSVLMFAGPGQGKSQSIIAGIMALSSKQVLPSMIIGDAAGEIYATTAAKLQGLGYDIGVIDLSNPDAGMKYNILAELDPHDPKMERLSEDLGQLLITNEPNSKQPHFVDFSRRILIGAIRMNVLYEGNNKTLPEIISEVVNKKKRVDFMNRMAFVTDEKVVDALELLQDMQSKPEGISMFTTMLRKLAPWRDDVVQKISDFGPDMYGRRQKGWKFKQVLDNPKPMAIFIKQGLLGETGDIARAIYGNAINAVKKEWDATGKPLKRPLRIIIDEPAKSGHCKAVVSAHNELRKTGVTVMMAFLSRKSLNETYHEDADTLYNGCDIVVFGGSKEMGFLQDVSRLVGDYTIESKGASESDHGESRSKNEQPRARIKPDEIRRLEDNEALMIVGNKTVLGLKGFEKGKKGLKHL